MSKEQESRIKDILIALPSTKVEGLKKLFWEELNYTHDNSSVSKVGWTEDFKNLFVGSPVSFATCATNDGFHILFFHLNTDKLPISTERQVVATLIANHPYSLFVFSNRTQDHWHLVNAIRYHDKKRAKQFILRRISVSKDDRLRTASERIAKLDVTLIETPLLEVSPIQIQKLHEEAFNVEAVTEEFFAEYKDVFKNLMIELNTQSADKIWAHDFSLQFMNRLMFIYYLERKGWLGEDSDFLHHFWREYLKLCKGSDRFVDEWLNILFFEAFNKKFSAGRSDYQYIPEKYRTALQLAPYLNGGLFSKNELDEKHAFHINDNRIGNILVFLDKYNFTISEDTPLDQEVAVDPEMIGKVYESLVNVSAEADEQSDAGIFYTPRIEIDLMCRLSLVDWLSNHLPEISKNALYELVFAFSPDEKKDADRTVSELGLWPKLEELLSGITVLDPACGSGSFLVGMLGILDDLLVRSNQYLSKEETPYERRKRIIGTSLYGVDIMEWAVHVAELRLWLQLVIDTELDLGERTCQALLPNLSFKLRQGDSLVQEVGGLNLSLHRQGGQLNRSTVNQLKALKDEKLKYFQNDTDRRYRTKAELTQAEFLLFEQVIADQIRTLEARKIELEAVLNPRENLFGEVQPSQMDLDSPKRLQELALVDQNLESLRSAKHVLHTQKSIPFVWDVAFVEVFEGEKGGFDIVIGNPPYTRHEDIRDLSLPPEMVTKENQVTYKNKLAEAVYAAWPNTFGFRPGRRELGWKLNRKSDLYVYFYLIGLSLVNPQGSFCFITSNSWLDAGYGTELQRFFLTRGEIKFVIDNQNKRSFKNADVNTIIILLNSPKDSKTDLQKSLLANCYFVMFKVPFEDSLSPIFWEEIGDTKTKKDTNEYRVIVKSQKELMETGFDHETGEYAGDKWGAKYLRSLDIYWVVMNKGSNLLGTLSEYFTGETYLNTGGADGFFIPSHVEKLNDDRYHVRNEKIVNSKKIFEGVIESQYLVPLVKDTTKTDTSITLNSFDAYCLVIKHPLSENILKYIQWGESQGYNKRSVISKQTPWYKPTNQMVTAAKFIMPRSFSDKHVIYYNPRKFITLRYYRMHQIRGDEKSMVAFLNSSLVNLMIETLGNKSQGLGVLDFYIEDFLKTKYPIIKGMCYQEVPSTFFTRQIGSIWDEFAYDSQSRNLDFSRIPSDRLILDEITFNALNLSKGEREAIYEAIVKMVNIRIQKARN